GLRVEKTLFGADGACSLFLLKKGKVCKRKFVRLEEKHPLGRFVDIDVTLKNAKASLSRKKSRKCFLCNKPAFYCGRIKAHTLMELLQYMDGETERYFTGLLAQALEKSLLKELELNNKFGLVCKNTQGSHSDLDYKVMKRAINAIKIPLTQSFFVGLNADDCEEMLSKLRPIGLCCEDRMYEATGGANAYKGFIFIGGVLLASVGYLINKSLPISAMEGVIKGICKGVDAAPEMHTFGYKAYKEYGFGGIRKLCFNGFDVVVNLSEKIESQPLLQSLCEIVGEIDDSVLLKRSNSFEQYEYFKNRISSVNVRDKGQLKAVNRECLENNISIGGAADVLIAAILLNDLLKIFYLGEV
ncbi:MAG: triphosphoribosyl-dephospho-CoA synthase, partial [Clostridia bacterium]|nr:triphosphoribosyl-dephospho-CoA synthase [Clostridia bacterium]